MKFLLHQKTFIVLFGVMVFTGIIQAVGTAVFDASNNNLKVEAPANFWDDLVPGDSVAVNGCCLTVLTTTPEAANFFVMEESRLRTNICSLANGNISRNLCGQVSTNSNVNLEKALKHGDFLGGHTLSGHVDASAPISKIEFLADGSKSIFIDLKEIESYTNLVVKKGSIALDGVSLTVADVYDDKIKVSLTPFTLQHTTLQYLKIGNRINIEFDQHLKLHNSKSNKISAIKNTPLMLLPEDLRNAIHEDIMQRAIELGERGRATSAPNPWVGCVFTDFCGNIIGEGFHSQAGSHHAEIKAMKNVISNGNQDKLNGSICYTTLEPCSHYGRTSPCDQFLIKLNVSGVVIALIDPDTKVRGSGIANSEAAGINVTTGICEAKAKISLRPYLQHRTTSLPFTILKLATSIDGKVSTQENNSQWITGEEARKNCHVKLRAYSQAIIIGAKTAEMDNPILTVRAVQNEADFTNTKQPLRVVVCSKPFVMGTNLMDTTKASTIVFTTFENVVPIEWELNGVEVIRKKAVFGKVDFREVLMELGKRGALQVLVEGGPTLATSILQQGLVNKLVVYQAPIIFNTDSAHWCSMKPGNASSPKMSWTLENVSVHGEDICVEYIK